jgi:predicted MFS family arabinose efflux permease
MCCGDFSLIENVERIGDRTTLLSTASSHGTSGRMQWGNVAGIGWSGAVSNLFLNIQPMVVGFLIDEWRLTLEQAGVVASGNMLGCLIGCAFSVPLITQWKLARFCGFGIGLMTLGNVACVFCEHSVAGTISTQVITGIGGGVVYSCGAATFPRFASPTRVISISVVAQLGAGSALFLIGPWLVHAAGLSGLFLLLAVCSLSVVAVLPIFNKIRMPEDPAGIARIPVRIDLGPAVLAIGAALFLNLMANNAVWSEYERFASISGLSPNERGTMLSMVGLLSMAGTFIAVGTSESLTRKTAALIGSSVMLLSIILLPIAKGLMALTCVGSLLMGSLGFFLPFALGELSVRDLSGRLVVVGYLTCQCGLFVGPFTAAFVTTRWSAITMIFLMGAFVLIATVLLACTFVARTAPATTVSSSSA